MGRNEPRFAVLVLSLFACLSGVRSSILFYDSFPDEILKWTNAADDKYNGNFELVKGEVLDSDYELVIPEKAKHYGLARKVEVRPSDFDELVIQYEVKYELGVTCSGAYLKLPLSPFEDISSFKDGVPYSVMFGPDKCGGNDKVHFIFQYRNQNTGELVEHHLQRPPPVATTNRLTHLYTLTIRGEDFEIAVDGEKKRMGKLSSADDFSPPLNPPEDMEDPEDEKPEDWEEDARIPDPEHKKPDDWDESEPKMIADPEAVKPEGWLEDEPLTIPDPNSAGSEDGNGEEDGESSQKQIDNPKCSVGCGKWVPPMIKNPNYKGKWTQRTIDNPDYLGEWKPRRIPNPEHYKVDNPRLLAFAAIGLELWVMDEMIHFDNILVASSVEEAEKIAEETWKVKFEAEQEAENERLPAAEDLFTKFSKSVESFMELLNTKIGANFARVGLEGVVEQLDSTGYPYPLALIVMAIALAPFIFGLLLSLFRGRGGIEEEEGEEGTGDIQPTEEEVTAQAKKDDAPVKDDEPTLPQEGEESEIKAETEESTLRKRK